MPYLKKIYVFFVLLIIFLLSNWAFIADSQLYHTHDMTHASRIAEMTRALEDGHFPVRWTENFAFGYGMPLFEFYAPLPYYIAAIFYYIGLDMILIVRLLYLIAGLFTIWGSYRLGKELLGKQAGLVTAAAFTLAPYRAVNIFVRGALSEIWGIMAMPWILLAIILFIKSSSQASKKKSWILLALSLVVLLLSHNLITLMFLPISFIFATFMLLKSKNFSKMLGIIGAYLLSIGLSAFYLLPAFLEKNFTQVFKIFEDYFLYSNHFLYLRQFFKPSWGYGGSEWGPNDGISFFLGYGQLLALVAVLLILVKALVINIKSRKKIATYFSRHALFIFLFSTFLFTAYLATFKSAWLWNILPLIDFIQFPWRWLALATLFLALICAYSLNLIKSKTKRFLFSLALIILILLNAKYFKFDKSKELPWEYTCVSEKCIRERMSYVLPDYIYIEQNPELEPIALDYLSSQDNLDLIVDRGHEKLLETKFKDNQQLELNIAAFPGWKLELDGKAKNWETGEKGNIIVNLPAGKHKLGAYFGYTNIRLIADAISLISFLIFLYIVIDND